MHYSILSYAMGSVRPRPNLIRKREGGGGTVLSVLCSMYIEAGCLIEGDSLFDFLLDYSVRIVLSYTESLHGMAWFI